MCGIFGIINATNAQGIDFNKTLIYLRNRGPDFQGAYQFENKDWFVKFHHTRLAILDLSADGNQPFESPACPFVLIYNGEIYNYLEIKKDLLDKGWEFSTKSDTEVLLKAWSQWGLEALHRLNGMFSFAVLNKVTQELWLVRDRFGVKPLHWGYDKIRQIFVFSSSLSAVAKCLDAPLDAQNCSLGLRFMVYDYEHKSSVFQGVQSVQPGGWIKLKLGNPALSINHGIWYSLDEAVKHKFDQLSGCNEAELLENCRHLLFDAVKLRLRSDVPLAVSLSGGLDSSSIAAIAAGMHPNLHGFTYGEPCAVGSEGPVVDLFCRKVGLSPHYIWPNSSVEKLNNLLERTLAAQESPFSGFSVMAQNEVFRLVRESGFKVLLGGQGGDETFAGYRKFFLVALRHAIEKGESFNVIYFLYSFGLMLIHEAPSAATYLQNLDRYRPKPNHSFALLNWSTPTLNLLGPSSTSLINRQIEDIQKWSLPSLLRYEDRNSMAYGIESRLPFLDYRLVESALCLPKRLKINNGFGKWALRQITEDIVPDFIRCNRRKRGFDVTQTWLQDGLGGIIRDQIQESKNVLKPFLKKNLKFSLLLSDTALKNDSKLLDEALMLCWLINPFRVPGYCENKK